MNKLEDRVKKSKVSRFLRNSILAGGIFLGSFFTPQTSQAQETVTGNIQSIPSMNIPKAKITFTDLSTHKSYPTINDTVTGNYSIFLPTSGNFQRKIESLNHYMVLDTVNISGNQNINENLIENIPVQSILYSNANKSFLYIFKAMTGTQNLVHFQRLFSVTRILL